MATEIIAEFPTCYGCGSQETVSKKAAKGEPANKEDVFTKLGVDIAYLGNPAAMALPTVKALVSYWDLCAHCGRKRYTLVEKGYVPNPLLALQGVPGMKFPQGG